MSKTKNYMGVVEGYSPPILSLSERKSLLTVFYASNKWVERLTNTSLKSWYK